MKARERLIPLVSRCRSLLQRFGSRSAWGLGGAMGASQLTMVVTAVLTARWLGPSGKGLVAAALSYAQILGWVAGLGVAAAVQIRVARANAAERPAAVATALGNGLAYSLGIGALITLAAFLPLQAALNHLGEGTTLTVTLALLPLPLAMLATTLGLLQIGLGRNRLYAASLVTGPVVTLFVVLAIHYLGRLTPAALVASYIPGGVVALGPAVYGLPWKSARLELNTFLGDLRLGIRVWLSSAMGLANLRLDLLVMATMLPARDVGLYSTASNVMVPVVVLPAALMQLAPTTTGRSDASLGRAAGLRALRHEAVNATATAIVAGIAVAMLAPIAVPWLLGNEFEDAVPLIWILVPGFVCRAFAGLVAAGANGLRLPVVGNVSEGLGLVVTIALLPLLLPAFGATGAAWTSTASYLMTATVAAAWLRRQTTGEVRNGSTPTTPPLTKEVV